MIVEVTRGEAGETLAAQLAAKGAAQDLRCGGRGVCGRCRVKLLEGEWESDGKRAGVPGYALSCRTKLLSERGVVEAESVCARDSTSVKWKTSPMPVSESAVIGIDIGTTTLAAVKVVRGEVAASAGSFNPQYRYGDNVLSRINAAASDLEGLRRCVTDACFALAERLGLEGVPRVAVSGNTVMSCLFHGVDPSSIGVWPFTPPRRRFEPVYDLVGGIPVYTVPCVSGYVGGDITAGLGEVGLRPGEMLVDIGTNCEIVFCTDSGMACTAAAAGPAFEGAGLGFGVRASDGAVDHYFGEGRFSCIGGGAPRGICGSAYVDFLAVERASGRLNDFGRFDPPADFMAISGSVGVSERDIEQLLKAKAAVHAGIVSLEEYCGATASKIYLAGGFAEFLDIRNAVAIGMLPDRVYERVGNTSLAGAARLACDPDEMGRLERLAEAPREVPLNTIESFQDNFIDSMLLP